MNAKGGEEPEVYIVPSIGVGSDSTSSQAQKQALKDPLTANVKEEPNDEINYTKESLSAANEIIKVPIIFEDSDSASVSSASPYSPAPSSLSSRRDSAGRRARITGLIDFDLSDTEPCPSPMPCEETLVVKVEPDEESLESYNSNDTLAVKSDTKSYKGKKMKRSSESPSTAFAPPAPPRRHLTVRHIDDLPQGHALETPLHVPKRRRVWEQFRGSTLVTAAATSSTIYLECGEASSAVASTSTSSLSSVRHPPRHYHPRQSLRDEDESNLINFGSDADSDDNDGDEDDVPAPMIPRAYRPMLACWDQDRDDVGDEGVVDAVPPADPAPVAEPAPATDGIPAPSATDQPWSLFDFQWREFPNPPIPPESRRETFSQNNVGPTIPDVDPYDIFVAIWDRQIMEYIASETNKYAQQLADQMIQNHTLHPNSRIAQWFDTTADELYVYFGIILAMGVVVKSSLKEYWSVSPEIFSTPGFSVHMSANRFLLINKCLHFVDNRDMCSENLDVSEARLFKIRPLLTHLNSKFQQFYNLSQNIALDESLLMWKGWLDISQLIPNKAANRGIKTYEVCESQTGYLWRFEVHAMPKSAPRAPKPEDPLERATPKIVLNLVKGLEHKGYTLWMDNFYNSPALARRLKCLGFDCVGTLRTDRQYLPEALHSLTKRLMREGQISGLTSGDVDVMVWRDANRVATISTYHGDAVQTIRGSTKPILVHDYNIMMGGVDKKDQILSMYPVERKRTKVWYKKLFRRLLNVSVLNSLIIHRSNSHSSSSSFTHRQFRSNLIQSLLSKHSAAPKPPRPPTKNSSRADVRHRLSMLNMGKSQRLRRRCAVCNKRVNLFCVGCDKSVCLEPCFLTLHS